MLHTVNATSKHEKGNTLRPSVNTKASIVHNDSDADSDDSKSDISASTSGDSDTLSNEGDIESSTPEPLTAAGASAVANVANFCANVREGWVPLGTSFLQFRTLDTASVLRATKICEAVGQGPGAIHASMSPTGAFFAAARNESFPFQSKASKNRLNQVTLVSCTPDPSLVFQIPFAQDSAYVLGLSWTVLEQLIVVLSDASIRVYDAHPYAQVTFNLNSTTSLQDHGFKPNSGNFQFLHSNTSTSLLFRSGSRKFAVLQNLGSQSKPQISFYSTLPPAFAININSLWCAYQSALSNETPELLVWDASTLLHMTLAGKNTLYSIDGIRDICVSPEGNFWACLSTRYHIEIKIPATASSKATSTWKTTKALASISVPSIVHTFKKNNLEPNDCKMQWCGEETVVFATNTSVLLLHVSGSHAVEEMIEPVAFSQGHRCLFLHSDLQVLQLSTVSEALKNVCQIGSTHPSALILLAYENSLQTAPEAVEILDSLCQKPGHLENAVLTCIRAATEVPTPEHQKKFLLAAQFGRTFLKPKKQSENPDANRYHNNENTSLPREIDATVKIRDEMALSCCKIRVLNSLRWSAGMLLPLSTFETLGVARVTQILANSARHRLAYAVCQILGHTVANVLSHWANYRIMINKDIDMSHLATLYIAFAKHERDVDFSAHARSALGMGHKELAFYLACEEKSAIKKIPVFLEIGKITEALNEAINSHIPDLQNLVIMYMRSTLKLSELHQIVSHVPNGTKCLESYALKRDKKLLRDFYFLEDRHLDLSLLMLKTGIQQLEETGRTDGLMESEPVLLRAQKLRSSASLRMHTGFSALNDHVSANAHTHVGLYLSLLGQQEKLYAEGHKFLKPGDSVNETIVSFLEKGNVDNALKLKKSFKVSEASFLWLFVRAAHSSTRFTEFEVYFKSAISYGVGHLAVDIIEELIRLKHNTVAVKLTPLCDVKEQLNLYLSAGDVNAAIDSCAQLKDTQGLRRVREFVESNYSGSPRDEILTKLDSVLAPRR